MKKIILYTICSFSLFSCTTAVNSKVSNKSFTPLVENEKVYVLKPADQLPVGSTEVGQISIGDSGFTTNCGYDKVISDAKAEAAKAGANVVKLTKIQEPSKGLGSTCYRIKATLYRNDNTEVLAAAESASENNYKKKIADNSDFAMIYFYRPSAVTGALMNYTVHDEEGKPIVKIHNGEKFAYKTTKYGPQKFYASLETRDYVDVNVEKGKEYYIKCETKMGITIARPNLFLIDNELGQKSYDLIEKESPAYEKK